MDKLVTFIEGYQKIEDDFGYWPSFHDDIIDKIEISDKGIIFFINMQTLPEGMVSYPKIKLMFFEIERFHLEGEIYGCTSIIFDIKFIKTDNDIETQLSSSLGTSGTIKSKKIQIEFV